MIKSNVGVFFGGRSVEHEISVISALQAIAALDTERYRAVPIYITKGGRWFTGPALLDAAAYRDMAALERRATEVSMTPALGSRKLWPVRRPLLGRGRPVAVLDVALPVFHGTGGEDGTFQGLLELTGIPYVGCGVLSSALGMDKIAAKMVLAACGLPVVESVWFTDQQWLSGQDALIARVEATLGYPAIVKPANLGSSVGISRARSREEFIRAVDEACRYTSRLLVERMIEPLREINCSVVGSADNNTASVCEEPVHTDEILSYADKYMGGGRNADGDSKLRAKSEGAHCGPKGGAKIASEGMASVKRRIPADLPTETADEIRRLASETFRVLDCSGVARVDFILDEGGGKTQIYVNEINAIPGSLSFYLWEATGIPFAQLLDRLVAGALKRDRDRSHKTVSYSDNIFSMGSFGSGAGAKGGTKFGGKK
ncbi:MAG: D-alanine--D-alanine ligase [Alistipes sp.]|jgi:D-alanine-D-alanine ligase|nr:D-alanine--D-alanine ligase [Alistipes sp.]